MTVAIAPDKENNTVTLPPLSVRRTVAKIAYNIRVADKVPDLELRSVRLCSVPGRTTLFTPASAPSTSEKDFTDAPLVELPDAARRSCSGVQYLFENPQGTVPSITDQRDKNADNAPSCASYLMIRAARGNRTLYYRVYLGRNNTTDFNVGRNTSHTLDITISGDNEVDTRVLGYTLSVTDDFESNRIGDYCVSSGGLLCIASDARIPPRRWRPRWRSLPRPTALWPSDRTSVSRTYPSRSAFTIPVAATTFL